MTTTRMLGGAIAGAMLLACSSGGGGASDPRAEEAQRFCTDVWAAYMDALVTCGEIGSAGAAYEEAQRATECATLRDSVAAGRVAHDAAQGAACLAALSAATCATLAAPLYTTACSTALAGKVQPGGACRADPECANGYCEFGASCPGVCVAYLALDADCMSGGTCGPGLTCRYSTTKCVTVTPGAEGQPCAQINGEGLPCQPGLYCDWDAGGTCRAPDPAAPCYYDWECGLGYRCTYGGGYDAGTCRAAAGPGGSCGLDSRLCQTDGYCAADGKCATLPTLGQSCATSDACLDGYCDETTWRCTASKGVGALCERDEECGYFGTCYGTQCVPSLCR